MALSQRRKPIPTEDVETLLRHLVEPDTVHTKHFIPLVGDKQDAFLERHFLYQMAMTALCLSAHERKDKRFCAVLSRFDETVVFPGLHRNVWTQSSFSAAMHELANLEKPTAEAKPLTWARGWFASIEADVTNPADLTLFVVGWQQGIFHMANLFADIGKNF